MRHEMGWTWILAYVLVASPKPRPVSSPRATHRALLLYQVPRNMLELETGFCIVGSELSPTALPALFAKGQSRVYHESRESLAVLSNTGRTRTLGD